MNKVIKIFTMVKDEQDIIEEWLIYHGSLFGYENIYIIDNFSEDQTYEILLKYQENKGINLSREKDYLLKSNYVSKLIENMEDYDIAYPLDADEFITYFDKEKNVINPNKVLSYIDSLPNDAGIFKTQTFNLLKEQIYKDGYQKPIFQSNYARAHQQNLVSVVPPNAVSCRFGGL